jgi:hypothetical protein
MQTVLAQIDNTVRKQFILQAGHGDQKMIRQVGRGRIYGHKTILGYGQHSVLHLAVRFGMQPWQPARIVFEVIDL